MIFIIIILVWLIVIKIKDIILLKVVLSYVRSVSRIKTMCPVNDKNLDFRNRVHYFMTTWSFFENKQYI